MQTQTIYILTRKNVLLWIYYTWSKTGLIENVFTLTPDLYPYPKSNPNTNPNLYSNPNPKAQLCFRTDEIMSFFNQV